MKRHNSTGRRTASPSAASTQPSTPSPPLWASRVRPTCVSTPTSASPLCSRHTPSHSPTSKASLVEGSMTGCPPSCSEPSVGTASRCGTRASGTSPITMATSPTCARSPIRTAKVRTNDSSSTSSATSCAAPSSTPSTTSTTRHVCGSTRSPIVACTAPPAAFRKRHGSRNARCSSLCPSPDILPTTRSSGRSDPTR